MRPPGNYLDAEANEVAADEWDNEPIHSAFGLSYASYLVIPRTVLQSMPVEWQREFCRLVNLTQIMFPGWASDGYRVHALDKRGKFTKDPLADYERGRRRLEPSCGGGYNEEKP